jgi:hypothetical protein
MLCNVARRSLWCCAQAHRVGILGVFVLSLLVAIRAEATTLLNDTWADGTRSNNNLPTDSAVWIGQSAGNGSNSVSAGHLNFVLPTNSLKFWTYFTSNLAAPDANQPHNAVTQLSVGDTLTASATFSLTGVTATTGKNLRMGLFFDPTDARVQSDVNSDGGGGTAPWTDALGYALELPLSSASGNNPFLIVKRTTSNTSLLGAGAAFTNAPTGGTAYSLANGTDYTVRVSLVMQSATSMDVTATLLQGNTVLATQTVNDSGTAFGGTVIGAGLLPGSQGVYTSFDQLFFRNSDASQATSVDFTNFKVDYIPVPEPGAGAMFVLGGGGLINLLSRRRKSTAR